MRPAAHSKLETPSRGYFQCPLWSAQLTGLPQAKARNRGCLLGFAFPYSCLPEVSFYLPVLFYSLWALTAFCACRGNSLSSLQDLYLNSLLVLPWEALSLYSCLMIETESLVRTRKSCHSTKYFLFYSSLPWQFCQTLSCWWGKCLQGSDPQRWKFFYKIREANTFLCLVSTAMFSPQPANFGWNFQTLLQEIQKMYSMLFPTAWIRWTSQATMKPATNKQTCTEFRNRMLLIYRSQQHVDGQGLVTNLQADLPWFDSWSFWQFKGKKHHKRAKSCGKFKGGTGKKTLE